MRGEAEPAMAKTTRGTGKRFRRRGAAEQPAPGHRTERTLSDVVGDHLIPEEQVPATTKWHPSRRGNSPHHRNA
jgi:hypothetical protein